MHLGESATLLRQRENESDKCTRDIISMKREQAGANTQKKIQIQRQRFTNRSGPSGPSGPSGESANSESEMVCQLHSLARSSEAPLTKNYVGRLCL